MLRRVVRQYLKVHQTIEYNLGGRHQVIGVIELLVLDADIHLDLAA
jgi:hypothetical protein